MKNEPNYETNQAGLQRPDVRPQGLVEAGFQQEATQGNQPREAKGEIMSSHMPELFEMLTEQQHELKEPQ